MGFPLDAVQGFLQCEPEVCRAAFPPSKANPRRIRRCEASRASVLWRRPLSGHLNCFPGEESRFDYDALQEHGIIDLIKTIFPKAVRMPNVGCNVNLPNSVAQHYHVDRSFLDDFMIVNAPSSIRTRRMGR
jgi:hypothetical protein